MAPTIAGAAFIRRSVSILNESRRAVEEVDQITGGVSGVVVAGLSMTAHLYLLPAALTSFCKRYPHVQLEIIEGTFNELESDLRNGSIEFYVGPQTEQRLAPDLVQDVLFANTRTIVGRKGHPLAGATSLRELTGLEWVSIITTQKGDEEFRRLFEHHGLPAPKVRLRGRSALTLITALQASDLLSMVPVQWLDFELTKDVLQAIHVKEELPAPPIVLIRRRELPLTPASMFLLDLFNRKIATLHLSPV